jgi:glycosyltransferase involved in cell wall biosynthesis
MVSFIVPCYNYAHFLGECVSSILSQTYPDFEVLIMDNNSPDNTPEVAASFGDPRVIHIRNEQNIGVIANINKGLALAKGEYVWLVNADDKLRNNRALEKFMRFLEKNPGVGFIVSPVVVLRDGKEDDELLGFTNLGPTDKLMKSPEVGYKALNGCPVSIIAALIKKRYLLEIGGFRPELPINSDWYLLGALGMAHDVGYVAEPMVNFRIHGSNSSTSSSVDFHRNQNLATFHLLRHRAEDLGLWTLAWAYQTEIPKIFVRVGRQAYRSGNLDFARENFRLALRSGAQSRRAYTGLFWVFIGKLKKFLQFPLRKTKSLSKTK